MKNILYSRAFKIIWFLVFIALIGTLFFKSYDMLARYDDYCELRQEVADRDNLWENHPYEIMRHTLNEALKEMVISYADNGIKGVSDYLKNYEDRWSHDVTKVFYVLFATEDEYYTNMDIEIPEEYKGSELEYVNSYQPTDEQDNGNVNKDDTVWLDANSGCVYDDNKEVLYSPDPDGERDESYGELEDALAKIDGKVAMKVYLSHAYVITVYNDYNADYNETNKYVRAEFDKDIQEQLIDMVMPAVGLVIVLTVGMFICGRATDGTLKLTKWDTKASELHIVIMSILSVPLVITYCWIYSQIVGYGYYNSWMSSIINTPVKLAYILMGTALVAAIFYELGVLIKKIKNKTFIKDFIIVRGLTKLVRRFVNWVKMVYDSSSYAALPRIKKIYVRKVIMDVIVAVVALVIVTQIDAHTDQLISANYKVIDWFGYEFAMGKYLKDPLLLYAFSIIGVVCYYINSLLEYRNLRNYNKVVKAIETIYYGDYKSVEIDENEKDEALKMLAHLSDNFEESVRKQVEAEKMQIDLVANVSHDLKTPLTSIISYVELLKEEEMSDVAKDYVKVLSDKSDRLKDIVADVFDLAKATSGEEVPMEQLDGVVLINQVLSDLHDKIEASGKEVRVNIVPEAAPLIGNGQKLYRVFQNIIDNALKYSMPGTRIYLNADLVGAEFVVTLKNVSEYEMDFTAEEIMSRFTRGDKSRHSEGNGLGLSIAKSFTELMGGTFTVEIDDDVFKTIVRLR